MYLPTHFKESRTDVLHALIAENPMGMLITNGQSGLDVNHLPFHLATASGGLGVLHAHVSRNNSVWKDIISTAEVIVVFQAGDAYISPNWYPSKHQTHEQVPTWNYIVIHARGRVTVRDDEKYVRGVVARLTRTHEASQPTPWKMTDGPKDYIDSQLQAIVGLEIEVTSLIGKFKLGQHKEVRDIQGPGEALIEQGNIDIGNAMLACAHAKNEKS